MTGWRAGGTRFEPDDVAPIAVARRSGFDESLFHGAGVVVGPDGTRVAALGRPDLAVYPRSALKPLQAVAMLRLGLDLPRELLAVACASHDGAPEHVAAVRRLLAGFGLDEADLQNTPSHPLQEAARDALIAEGIAPAPVYMNCSGKHAAMLATCRINGWPIASYLEFDHPLQEEIRLTLEKLGTTVEYVGVDGCGAPTHVIPLDRLAAAYATLPGTEVHAAMTGHPGLVGGPARDVTLWMSAVPGLLAKEGAAAVMAFVLPDGTAGAYKIAPGVDPVRRVVFPMALTRAGVDVDAHPVTLDSIAEPVLGHGERVGEIRPLDWSR